MGAAAQTDTNAKQTSKASKVRLAVVGTGMWSKVMHLPALRNQVASGAMEIVGVCDLRASEAAAYAAELSCSAVYSDVEQMLREQQPEGLAILLPPEVSHQMIEIAIKHRMPFLCEKPPVKDAVTHAALRDRAGDLKHVIAYNRRYAPYLQQAKTWLAGTTVQSVSALFSRHRRLDEDFSTTAVHPIDSMQFLGGEQIQRGRIEMMHKDEIYNYYINGWSAAGIRYDLMITPDTASAEEKYIMRGTDKTVVISFPQKDMYDVPGYVELHQDNKVVERKSAADYGIDPEDLSTLGGFYNEYGTFAEVLRDQRRSPATLYDTYMTQVLRQQLGEMVATATRYAVHDFSFP